MRIRAQTHLLSLQPPQDAALALQGERPLDAVDQARVPAPKTVIPAPPAKVATVVGPWSLDALSVKEKAAIREAVRTSLPGPAAASALAEGNDDEAIVQSIFMGQEITILQRNANQPRHLAAAIVEVLGGEVVVPDGMQNKRADAVTPVGTFRAEFDNAGAKGTQILEVAGAPLRGLQHEAFAKQLLAIHTLGAPERTVGGGHIHIDGAPFAAAPRLFSRFMQLYLHREPELLGSYDYRHFARQSGARGYHEKLGARIPEFIARIKEMQDLTSAAFDGAMRSLIDDFKLDRWMAINLVSFTGVAGGNKKSKGTIEARFFDSPPSLEHAMQQREVLRSLLRDALSNQSIAELTR